MLTTDERRRAQRSPLALPLEVKWQENSGEVQEPATIRDISATGLYFLFERDLPVDSKVEFYVRLQVEGAPAGSVLLRREGSIAPVGPTGDEPRPRGGAARVDR